MWIALSLLLFIVFFLLLFQSARYSKLEKADILELTVRHLREGQQQHMNGEFMSSSEYFWIIQTFDQV